MISRSNYLRAEPIFCDERIVFVVTINGNKHRTISDAAAYFGVSVKTVQDWISKGKIQTPPQEVYGSSMIQVFPPDFLKDAKRQIAVQRKKHLKKNTAVSGRT